MATNRRVSAAPFCSSQASRGIIVVSGVEPDRPTPGGTAMQEGGRDDHYFDLSISNADFLTLLSQAGIDPTDATHTSNSLPSPAVVEIALPGALDRSINQPIPDVTLNGGTAQANQPQVLLIQEDNLSVDTDWR